ncbi:IS110 family transposase [Sphingopyxis terrae]|uniref:IS110 family transposase n=1 Tax=Sphingopyxis terrae TaxID=33052 RepID=UPI003F81E14D
MENYAGLDLSMESTQVCIIDEKGRTLASEKVESCPAAIADMLDRHAPLARAVIETGRMSPAICHGLRELGVPLVCIDARQAHQSLKAMKANKTDPHDAAGLAQLARTGFYKEAYVKSPAAHGVRSVIAARSHLVEARVKLDNMIRGLCATFGCRPGPGQGKAFLDRIMEAPHIPGLGQAIASLLSIRSANVDQTKEMDRRLRLIASQSQACEILMTIPGVGIQTSAAFAAAIDEAGRFRQSRNVGAYFGLVPRRHQSGEIDWTGRITKQGDGMVRKLLYEAANSILTRSRETFALKTWAMKIAKRRGLKKARVAGALYIGASTHPRSGSCIGQTRSAAGTPRPAR